MIVGKPKSGKTSFVLSAVGDNEALQSGILPKFDYVSSFAFQITDVTEKEGDYVRRTQDGPKHLRPSE